MLDYKTPLFKTSEVAEAAGIPVGTLRAYFSRGHWRIIGKKAEGEGLPNLFSLRDALTFAIAAKLVEAGGVHPKTAFETAVTEFAHVGSDHRLPGRLYDIRQRGETILVYWPSSEEARLIAEQDFDGIGGVFGRNAARVEAALLVVLNPIEQRVFSTLGIQKD